VRLPDGTGVELLFFSDVTNSKEVKDLLLSGELECTVVDSRMVVDVFQVMVAVQMAHHASLTGKLSTKTVHSEVLYNLSAMRSISTAFKTFGFDENLKQMLIICLGAQRTTLDKIREHVKGSEVRTAG